MTYRPNAAAFGPPWSIRVPSLVHVAVALAVAGLVIVGETSPSNSWLFAYVVEHDADRVLGARTLAIVLALSSTASMVRTAMRGVRIRPDGVEYRDLVSWALPRVRRYKWPQIDRVVLDQKDLALDLWDGSRAFLPPVSDRDRLAATLEKIALARAIPVKGGGKLDEIPDSADYPDEE
jgi:hypothetical protein